MLRVEEIKEQVEEHKLKKERELKEMTNLSVSLDKVDIKECDTEREIINKHLQTLYNNQRSVLEKFSLVKKDLDYQIKYLTDEVEYLVSESNKRKNNIFQ